MYCSSSWFLCTGVRSSSCTVLPPGSLVQGLGYWFPCTYVRSSSNGPLYIGEVYLLWSLVNRRGLPLLVPLYIGEIISLILL